MLRRKKKRRPKPQISTDDFIKIVLSGDITEINIALRRRKAAIDGRDEQQRTVLHWACQNNDVEVVRFLLEAISECQIFHTKEMQRYENIEKMNVVGLKKCIDEAHLSVRDLGVPNPRKIKAWTGKLRARAICARTRSYLDIPDKHGQTAIHWACRMGFPDILKLLVEEGNGNIETRDQKKWTALHWACKVGPEKHSKGHDACAVYLSHVKVDTGKGTPTGCNLSQQDSEGMTPLHWACRYGYSTIVEALISQVFLKTDDLGRPSPEIDKEKNSLILDLKDKRGWQVHHWAALGGDAKTMKLVLSVQVPHDTQAGAKQSFLTIDARTKKGLTPALIGATYGNTECVRICQTMGSTDPEEIAKNLKLWQRNNAVDE
eukprot:g5350.t1